MEHSAYGSKHLDSRKSKKIDNGGFLNMMLLIKLCKFLWLERVSNEQVLRLVTQSF